MLVIVDQTNKGTDLRNIIRAWSIYNGINLLLRLVQSILGDLVTTEFDLVLEELTFAAVSPQFMFV